MNDEPKKEAIDRLRDILKKNHGDGAINLVWGPNLEYSPNRIISNYSLDYRDYRPKGEDKDNE